MSADAAPARDRGRLFLHLAALLSLPILVSLALPDWIYPAPGVVDSWVYNGFFRHLDAYASTMFPDTYYGTRLGWILPGHYAYAWFGAFTANLLLRVAFYTAAVIAIYGVVAAASNSRAALFAAIAFGLYLPTVRGLGDDYVATAVVAYSAVGGYLMLRAGQVAASRWWGFAGGVATGAMLHSNFGSLFLVPSLLIWIVPIRRDRIAWRDAAWSFWHWGLGIVACTLLLAQYSLTHGGMWPFFAPTFAWVGGVRKNNPFEVTGTEWVLSVPWSFLPAALVAMAAGVALLRSRRLPLTPLQLKALGAFGVTMLIFGAWDFIGPGAAFSLHYYIVWFYPTGFVMVGAVLIGSARGRQLPYVLIAVLAAVLSASLLHNLWFVLNQFRLAVLIACVGLGVAASFARSPALKAAVVTALLLCVVCSLPYHGREPARPGMFQVIDRGIRFTERFVTTNAAPRFMLAPDDRLRYYMDGIAAAYLWTFTTVTMDFPHVTPQQASQVAPGTVVVILSGAQGDAAAFDTVFSTFGLRGELLGSEVIDTAVGPMHMTALQARTAERVVD